MISLKIFIGILTGCVAVIVLLSWALYAQISQVKKLTSMVNILMTNMRTLSKVIKDSEEILNNPELKEAFQYDDEVGTFFTQISDIQNTLSKFILSEETEQEDYEEKK